MEHKINRTRGASFGKKGGRPKDGAGITNAELYRGEPYGMQDSDYNEIVAFLESPQAAPVYPKRMSGGSSVNKNGKKTKS